MCHICSRCNKTWITAFQLAHSYNSNSISLLIYELIPSSTLYYFSVWWALLSGNVECHITESKTFLLQNSSVCWLYREVGKQETLRSYVYSINDRQGNIGFLRYKTIHGILRFIILFDDVLPQFIYPNTRTYDLGLRK